MSLHLFSDLDINEDIIKSIEVQKFTKEQQDIQEQKVQVEKQRVKRPFPMDKKLFTTSKGNSYFILDNTKLLPKPKTLFGGGFKLKYKRQLDESIYNVTDKSIYELMEMLYLYKQIMDDMYPIVIRSSSYPKLTSAISESLDEFFKVNSYVIGSIYDTVDSSFFGVM